MNNLIIIGHPDKASFCYNGILATIQQQLARHQENYKVIDLYEDKFSFNIQENTDLIIKYKSFIQEADRLYFISPVWWFRCTPQLECFFDQVFTPGFAYNFKPITKKYGIPKPLLGHKKVRTYLTHGAPALPVVLLYLNSVKLRLIMGVYSFVFGWFKTKTRQFWSVPFSTEEERKNYLDQVIKDIKADCKS